VPVFAQRPEEHHENPRANQGHIPQGPSPKRDVHAKPEIERHEGRVNSIPHVNNDHWYGHDKPNDRRYVIAHPFEHGRFEHFGPSYRYKVLRFDRDHHRFWFPGVLQHPYGRLCPRPIRRHVNFTDFRPLTILM